MALVEKLERELKEAQARLNAAKEFPDLQETKDRWGIVRLTTKATMVKAVEFEVKTECDCCSGVTVYALPYIEFEGVRLYSHSVAVSFAKLYVGKKYRQYVADDDWDETAEWEAYNGLLLDKIAEWLDKHDADSGDDDDLDDEDELEDIEDDTE